MDESGKALGIYKGIKHTHTQKKQKQKKTFKVILWILWKSASKSSLLKKNKEKNEVIPVYSFLWRNPVA